MTKDKKKLSDYKFYELNTASFHSESINAKKRDNLISHIKRLIVLNTKNISYQISRDMFFWIKYRPSLWLSFLPIRKKDKNTIKQFIIKKNSKQFIFYSFVICCLIFVGFLPTVNFIFSNFFKIWLIPIIIPIVYWAIAITAVYSRVIAIKLVEIILVVFKKSINRKL